MARLAKLVGGAVRRSQLLRGATAAHNGQPVASSTPTTASAAQLCTAGAPHASGQQEPPAAERPDLSPLLHPHSARRCVRAAQAVRVRVCVQRGPTCAPCARPAIRAQEGD